LDGPTKFAAENVQTHAAKYNQEHQELSQKFETYRNAKMEVDSITRSIKK
jgi:hypothetical protein